MPRLARIEFPDATYALRLRGNPHVSLAQTPVEYGRFRDILSDCVAIHDLRLYAFIVMPEEIQLLLKTPNADLGRAVQRICTRYALAINHSRGTRGPLFAGRYQAKLVARETHLLPMFRLLHLAPVLSPRWRAEPPEERRLALRAYARSSFRAYAGTARPLDFMAAPDLFPLLDTADDPYRQLVRYIENGLDKDLLPLQQEFLSGGGHLGSPALPAGLSIDPPKPPPEEVFQRTMDRLGIDRAELQRFKGGRKHRIAMAKALTAEAGLTQTQTAEWLGLSSGAAVSLLLKAGRESTRSI